MTDQRPLRFYHATSTVKAAHAQEDAKDPRSTWQWHRPTAISLSPSRFPFHVYTDACSYKDKVSMWWKDSLKKL